MTKVRSSHDPSTVSRSGLGSFLAYCATTSTGMRARWLTLRAPDC